MPNVIHFEADLSESVPPAEQSNASLANRIIKDCSETCDVENCDAQQIAYRLTNPVDLDALEGELPCGHYAPGDHFRDGAKAVCDKLGIPYIGGDD